ncbi:MAG: alpha/beta hydrolase [Actinomycetia bacterium]|nr:alpha/beta hydrolase [Actinomycetes bacterium]
MSSVPNGQNPSSFGSSGQPPGQQPPAYLGSGGALQPGALHAQRPGPYGSGGPPVGPGPRKSSAGQTLGIIAGVLVLALLAGVGIWWSRQGEGNTPLPTPTLLPSPSAAGQTVSKPPVPSPTATTSRRLDSPDRPQLPVPDVKPPGFINPPAGSGMGRYTSQKVLWQPCTIGGVDLECTRIAAPLDYAAPDGQALTLTLSRVKATQEKVGTIFVNPGGPGSGGIGLAARFNRTGLEMYDIVGWDPRGTGTSTPVVCHNGAEIDALMQLDQSPDDEAEKQALLAGYRALGQGCLEKSGPLLHHISTLDTVQDLDLMRHLMGDSELSYLGYSYGTYIGAVYAEKFPQRVGKLVLDAAVNITDDESVIQASGFDLALGNYAEYCAKSGSCPLGSTKDEVLKTIVDLLEKLDQSPATGDGTRKLTQSLALDGIAMFLYFDSSEWDALTTALEQARRGDGASLLRVADLLRDRNPNGQYDTSHFAFPAIGCADHQDDGSERAFADWQLNQKKAPVFGKYFGPGVTCTQWPVAGTKPFEITGAGASPIVVIGATGDSATPYQFSAWMADKLESGVLVTYEGNGHATYGNGKSACIDEAVVAYFAEGKVPPDGLYCKP